MPTVETLGTPNNAELAVLSKLAMRSKAYWGYDAAFMRACETALTLTPAKIAGMHLGVTRHGHEFTGFVQLGVSAATADLDKLFVDPAYIGKGYGKALITWAIETSLALGAHELLIDSDPGAVPFYQSCGAVRIGETPSEAIPGRNLPLLRIEL